jgi:hypothetical protein
MARMVTILRQRTATLERHDEPGVYYRHQLTPRALRPLSRYKLWGRSEDRGDRPHRWRRRRSPPR